MLSKTRVASFLCLRLPRSSYTVSCLAFRPSVNITRFATSSAHCRTKRSLSTSAQMSSAAAAPAPEAPWWAGMPEPQATCETMENSQVMQMLDKVTGDNKHVARDFLLVDVRRTDWDGGTVATSINLPAQSFYQTRPIVYQMCKQAEITKIIFYCGSSGGRGTRTASWMQDYLNEVGETGMKAIIMEGGIKGWHKTYGGKMMDWYDEKAWASKV